MAQLFSANVFALDLSGYDKFGENPEKYNIFGHDNDG